MTRGGSLLDDDDHLQRPSKYMCSAVGLLWYTVEALSEATTTRDGPGRPPGRLVAPEAAVLSLGEACTLARTHSHHRLRPQQEQRDVRWTHGVSPRRPMAGCLDLSEPTRLRSGSSWLSKLSLAPFASRDEPPSSPPWRSRSSSSLPHRSYARSFSERLFIALRRRVLRRLCAGALGRIGRWLLRHGCDAHGAAGLPSHSAHTRRSEQSEASCHTEANFGVLLLRLSVFPSSLSRAAPFLAQPVSITTSKSCASKIYEETSSPTAFIRSRAPTGATFRAKTRAKVGKAICTTCLACAWRTKSSVCALPVLQIQQDRRRVRRARVVGRTDPRVVILLCIVSVLSRTFPSSYSSSLRSQFAYASQSV